MSTIVTNHKSPSELAHEIGGVLEGAPLSICAGAIAREPCLIEQRLHGSAITEIIGLGVADDPTGTVVVRA